MNCLLSSVTLKISGLKCGGCSAKLKRRLAEIDGVADASVNFTTSSAHVDFNAAQVSLEQLLAVCRGAGVETAVTSLSEPRAEASKSPLQLRATPEGLCGRNGCSTGQVFRPLALSSTSSSCSMQISLLCSGISSRTRLIRVIHQLPRISGVTDVLAVPHGPRRQATAAVTLAFCPEKVQPRTVMLWFIRGIGRELKDAKLLASAAVSEAASEAWQAAKKAALVAVPAVWCVFSGMHPTLSLRLQDNERLTAATALAALYVWVYGGAEILLAAVKCLRVGVWTMDLLVALSTTTTILFSLAAVVTSRIIKLPVFFESSAGVLLAVLVGRAVEAAVRAAVVGRLRVFAKDALPDAVVVVDGPNDEETSSVPPGAQVCFPRRVPDRPVGANAAGVSTSEVTLSSFSPSGRQHPPPLVGTVAQSQSSVWAVPIPLLNLGDLIRAGPEDIVPVDGVLEQDACVSVDEAVLSGEARPVCKGRGDVILAGSKVCEGPALIRVTAVGSGSFLGRVRQLMDHAAAATQPRVAAANIADRLAQKFVGLVLLLAALTTLAWTVLVLGGYVEVPELGGERSPPLRDGSPPSDWVAASGLGLLPSELGEGAGVEDQRDPVAAVAAAVLFVLRFPIAVVAVACPCALAVATPVAVACAVAAAGRCGVVIKNFDAVYRAARRVRHVVWDKTGTLTLGEMRVVEILALPESEWEWPTSQQLPPPPCRKNPDAILQAPAQWQALALAAAAVRNSSHPVSRAIAAFCAERLAPQLPPAVTALEVAGHGVAATLPGGLSVRVGRPSFCCGAAVAGNSSSNSSSSLYEGDARSGGGSAPVTAVAVAGKIVAQIKLADPIREEAASVVALMGNYAAEQWLCSGDHPVAAQALALAVGIPADHVHAAMLPEQKVDLVRALKATAAAALSDSREPKVNLVHALKTTAAAASSDSRGNRQQRTQDWTEKTTLMSPMRRGVLPSPLSPASPIATVELTVQPTPSPFSTKSEEVPCLPLLPPASPGGRSYLQQQQRATRGTGSIKDFWKRKLVGRKNVGAVSADSSRATCDAAPPSVAAGKSMEAAAAGSGARPSSRVIVIGDGVNDAPAMVEADIAIAVPCRLSEVVSAAADVVLMSPSLGALPKFFRIARHAEAAIRFNLFWAFAFNLLALPAAAGLLYPRVMLSPALAGALMALSSCVVVGVAATLLIHN